MAKISLGKQVMRGSKKYVRAVYVGLPHPAPPRKIPWLPLFKHKNLLALLLNLILNWY